MRYNNHVVLVFTIEKCSIFGFFVFVSHCVCNYVFSLEISWLRETLYAFRNMLYNETNLTFCKTNGNSEHKIILMQCHPIAKNKTVKIVRMFATDACYKNIDILSHQLETKTNTQYRRNIPQWMTFVRQHIAWNVKYRLSQASFVHFRKFSKF